MNNRRQFLTTCAATSGALLASRITAQTTSRQSAGGPKHPLVVFAKPLEHFKFDELGKRLQSIGVQGIEATLRAGGQVEPENFERELGPLTEALAKHEQRVMIAACDINDVSAASQTQLQQFSKHAIAYIRMMYYRYDFSKAILPQLDAFAKQATELASLCKSLGITALYQNHAGKNYVGSALWDLQQVLRAVDPTSLAVALDIRHTVLELSQSWPSAYSVIRPHIGAIYVKDVAWVDNKPENVPLGSGLAKPIFDAVQKDGLIGPLSLHVEYFDHKDPSLQEQRWQAVVQDVATLRQWMA